MSQAFQILLRGLPRRVFLGPGQCTIEVLARLRLMQPELIFWNDLRRTDEPNAGLAFLHQDLPARVFLA